MGRADWSPLSHGQEALWFLWKLVPRTWAYNIVLPVGVRGPLDAAAFRRSLQILSDRHPSIRTEFSEESGKPAQRSIEGHRVQLEEIDASSWTDIRIDDALLEKAREPFDLERDATLRVTLFRRAADHHVLLIAVHHIVSDLWSLIVLMDELRQLYAAEIAGTSLTLPPIPVTVEQYVRQQRELAEGDAGEALWSYWQQELSGDPSVLDLPADHSRPAMQSFRGGIVTRRMDAELTRRIKELSGKERVTPFMTLLAAYQVLLGRYTAQESFFVGSPTSGRDRAELQGVVGDFVNMVPIRADLTGTPTFREVLARVRTKVVGTIKHQDYPFSLLIERLHPARDLSRSPIFQTTFVLQKFHRFQELSRVMLPAADEPAIPFADLMLEPIALAQQDGQFDVNLEMKEDEKGRLVGAWKYAAALFDASTIERMAAHFETLLGEIVVHPDLPIRELRLLSDEESRAAIATGQGPVIAPPNAVTVCELFERQIAQRPDAIALSCGDESLTYAELGQRVTALARRLATRGIGRDVLVAVKLPRGLDFIIAILAIHKAGGGFLPLDARHPASRTQQIVENSGAALVLTPEELLRLNDTPMSEHLPAISGSDLAYVMYTSGSTGAPKGVMVEHRGMVNHVLAKLSDLGMTETDVLAQNGPPTFDIVVWQCLAPLVVGGRVVVFPDEVAEDPAQLLAEIGERGITVLQVVPSMLNALLVESPRELKLRWMVPTGEALPTALCRRWLELYPHIPILNTYGSTECSDDQCHYAMHGLSAADDAVAIASIGTPIRNMTAHVLDSTLAPVPAGVVGELYIGGIGVGRGYLGDPERTAAAFVPDPFSDHEGARLYRTRDHARRRADGALDFLGRTDSMIKLRGQRIEPGEIEAALTSHAAIREAAVVARTNPNGERVLVAYLVSHVESGEHPEVDVLRRHLTERVPQSMVPSHFCFIDAMPLSANGKHDHRALPAPEWGTIEQELVAPRTPTEERIAGIWAEVLGVDRVGVTQDFFSIGGDSIRSIQIVARCKRAGIHLRPSDLFQHSTIAALAALADSSAYVPESTPLASLEVSQEHLDRALAQVVFDGE